jgi:hypothetical protein
MTTETIKGRVGNFTYGIAGKMRWIVRDRRTGEVVAIAENLNGASRLADRFNGGIR